MLVRPEVHYAFHNRENEKHTLECCLEKLSREAPQFLLFFSNESYGSTFFLKKMQQDKIDKHLGIYLDCNEKSLDSFLRNTIFELGEKDPELASQIKTELNKIDQSSATKRAREAAISALPYVGKPIKEFTASPKTAISASYRIQASPNAILEIISEHFSHNSLCIFIDNFDAVDNEQLGFLVDIVFFLNHTCVQLVACQNSAEVDKKNIVKLQDAGFVCEVSELEPLSINDLMEVAKDRDVQLKHNDLLPFANKSVYETLNYIQSRKGETNSRLLESLSPVARYLISILIIAEQPVSEGFLLECTELSKLIYVNSNAVILNELDELRERQILKHSEFFQEDYFQIIPTQKGRLKREISLVEVVTHTEEAYSCIKTRLNSAHGIKSPSDYFFAFTLSLSSCRHESGYWASKILLLSLSLRGTFNLLDYIKDFLKPAESYETFLLCLAGAMQRKDYAFFDEVYSLGSFQFQSNTEALLFKAICENRLRRYDSSNSLLSLVRSKPLSADVESIVVSVELINLFHTGKISRARELFNQKKASLEESSAFAYCLRIGAAMMPVEDGIRLISEILPSFKESGDHFGYITTQANLGAYLCKTGELEDGCEVLNRAYSELLIYGPENITHCALSLATVNLKMNNFREAKLILKKLLTLPEDSHYSIVARYLVAECELLSGRIELSLDSLNKLLIEVSNTPTQNIKTRFFVNYALAKCVAGEFDEKAKHLLQLAIDFMPDLPGKKWQDAYDFAKEAIDSKITLSTGDFLYYSLTGYFEYWWFNPLPVLMNRDS